MDSQTKKFYLKIGVAILVAAFLIYKNPKSPGSIYAPDMAFSRAYETYTDNNPRGTMLPVANTISRNALPSDELYQKEKSVIYSYNYVRFFQNNIHIIKVPKDANFEIEARILIDGRKKYDIPNKTFNTDQTIDIAKKLINKNGHQINDLSNQYVL